jgi:hypothetical protein
VAQASGEGRALEAARRSLCSPLLDNNLIAGAKKILINIAANDYDKITYEEGNEIVEYIQAYASYKDDNGIEHRADIIWGASSKEVLDDETIEVVVVATGFDEEQIIPHHESFPGLGDNIEILQAEKESKEENTPLSIPKKVIIEPRRDEIQGPITLDRRPSKYLNLEAELKLPAFVRRNMKMVTDISAAGRKDVLRVDADEESAPSRDNRLSF